MATTDHIASTPIVTASTINNYLRAKKVEPIFRKNFLLSALREYGRISYNQSGPCLEWRPRFRRQLIETGGGSEISASFPDINTRKIVTLPWRQYQMGRRLSKFTKLANRGAEAFYNIVQTLVDEMTADFQEDLRTKLYKDGNLAGSTEDFHGLESIFGNTGAVISGSTFASCNDTYAGISTAPGTLGSWTGNWPVGVGDVEYCWWTPFVNDVNNHAYQGDTWRENWREAIRDCSSAMSVLQGVEPSICLLDRAWLNTAKQTLDTNERFVVDQNSPMRKLGFPTIQFEDIEFAFEYGNPTSSIAYLFPDQMEHFELHSMQDDLIVADQDRDITTQTDMFYLDCFGNCMFEAPSFFGKLMGITAAGT
ncbi:MAG: phage major capsid protein [Planctomycetota bacterium]|jgi:hypothetical protein